MKLALALLVVLAACGGSSKTTDSPATTTTTTTTQTTTATPAEPASAQATTTSTPPAAAPVATPVVSAKPAAKPLYSCFSYSQRGATVKRSACMRTEECGPYLEQAKQVGGIVPDGGCASVAVLFCFHQAASKTDPQGLDVCQPTMDSCKSERALLVKKGSSADTDCAQR
jgi:hypothetical protein